ncbi:hypothetical protein HON71_00340 [Candidatus Woesearchaeota archaeon]|jgi:hypothetical protein|nr:hypothetical protein [Candidatus Woesearchaeota archaeon]MBT5342116.1 hypothetical protein [Candidatus Woesearchaeota archaeon]
MPKQIALLYRDLLKDYVVNERGNLIYEPRNSEIFPELNEARNYILKNYGGKKTRILIDDHCLEEGGSELEKKLKKAKIKIE